MNYLPNFDDDLYKVVMPLPMSVVILYIEYCSWAYWTIDEATSINSSQLGSIFVNSIYFFWSSVAHTNVLNIVLRVQVCLQEKELVQPCLMTMMTKQTVRQELKHDVKQVRRLFGGARLCISDFIISNKIPWCVGIQRENCWH